jgi:O-antigen ligase
MIRIIGAIVFLVYLNAPAVLANFHGFPRIVALAVPLLLGIPIAYRALVLKEPIRFPGMLIAAILLLFCHTLSALLSQKPHIGMGNVFEWLTEGVLLAFLLVNALRTRAEVLIAANAMVAAGALMGLIVLVQQILGPMEYSMAGFGQIDSQDVDRLQHRLAGPIGEKNRFAQVLLVLIPIAVGLAAASNRRRRWLYGLATILIFVGVGLTFSRGAIVAFVLVVPFALLFGLLRVRHILYAGVFGSLLIVLMPFITATPYMTDRILSIGEVVFQAMGLSPGGVRNADGASRGRLTSMKAAGLIFLDHPVVGAGPGMAPLMYQDYAALVGGKVRVEQRRTHNLYLQLAAETGIVGLIAFLFFIGVILYPLDQARRRSQYHDRQLWGLICGTELAVFLLLTTSIFLHAAYIRYTWLLFGLAASAHLLPFYIKESELFVAFGRDSKLRLMPPEEGISDVITMADERSI